jgi:hypothetical protein
LNLSAISNRSFYGKALRLPLRFIPDWMEMPIVQGRLKGKRWVVGSSNHGCWLGSDEFEKQREISTEVRSGMVAYDIVANVGFYTLLLSDLVGPQGITVAFEPVPGNCDFLRRHIAVNHCENVVILELALADFDGTARFSPSRSNSEGHLSARY